VSGLRIDRARRLLERVRVRNAAATAAAAIAVVWSHESGYGLGDVVALGLLAGFVVSCLTGLASLALGRSGPLPPPAQQWPGLRESLRELEDARRRAYRRSGRSIIAEAVAASSRRRSSAPAVSTQAVVGALAPVAEGEVLVEPVRAAGYEQVDVVRAPELAERIGDFEIQVFRSAGHALAGTWPANPDADGIYWRRLGPRKAPTGWSAVKRYDNVRLARVLPKRELDDGWRALHALLTALGEAPRPAAGAPPLLPAEAKRRRLSTRETVALAVLGVLVAVGLATRGSTAPATPPVGPVAATRFESCALLPQRELPLCQTVSSDETRYYDQLRALHYPPKQAAAAASLISTVRVDAATARALRTIEHSAAPAEAGGACLQPPWVEAREWSAAVAEASGFWDKLGAAAGQTAKAKLCEELRELARRLAEAGRGSERPERALVLAAGDVSLASQAAVDALAPAPLPASLRPEPRPVDPALEPQEEARPVEIVP
jgi:hypothetical protein